jgi:protocatechuate 3,4-dioxygenase beta subunit
MNRRDFIKQGSFLAFGISVIGPLSVFGKAGNEKTCETTKDILGPFYRPEAPFRKNMVMKDAPADLKINVSGTVYTSDCTTPLNDVLVEVWQANQDGEYDNETKNFNYRASIKTDSKGKYNFETIIPGKYMNGDQYRPSHIHFRIRAKEHREIVSQIYFKEDPYIAVDPWASQPEAAQRILPIMDDKTGKQVIFDIYMAKADL